MWWRPDTYQTKIPNLKIRQQTIKTIRDFFYKDDFFEVETPALQHSPGLEPHLHAFKTLYKDYQGNTREYYLHTSPEFTMKKLLVAGLPKIFNLCHCFRNSETSPRHCPEFLMLEWYRTGCDYTKLMDDCVTMVRDCFTACGAKAARYGGNASDPFKEWEKITVSDAFIKYADIDLLATVGDNYGDPAPSKLAAEARRIGVSYGKDDRWDDIFFRICMEKVEPYLGMDRPTILYEYPIPLAVLSKTKASDRRVAERFELYICGLELANAFSELTDAVQQRQRFEADVAKKFEIYGDKYPIDDDFIAALAYGMPECAGIALGVDRLAMVIAGIDDIKDIMWAELAQ